MTDKVHHLFAYGTLNDPRIQQELFGRVLPGTRAWIENWGLFQGEKGYLFVKPLAGRRVRGMILPLNDSDLSAADLWEDMDVYEREPCRACLEDDRSQTVWLYTRRTAQGEAINEMRVPMRSDSDILADVQNIRELIKQFPESNP